MVGKMFLQDEGKFEIVISVTRGTIKSMDITKDGHMASHHRAVKYYAMQFIK